MPFLPTNYEIPTNTVAGRLYLKIQPGDNKIRILTTPITGWLYWNNEDRPVRMPGRPAFTPYDFRSTNKFGDKERMKHFWAMVVWNYATDSIGILEITQGTVQEAIIKLYHDDEWGDPREYNIKINRSGERLETTYSVIPMRPTPVPEEAKAELLAKPIALDALFYGADPTSATWESEARENVMKRIASAVDFANRIECQPQEPSVNLNTTSLPGLLGYLEIVQEAIAGHVQF